jgi:hypothetical protein
MNRFAVRKGIFFSAVVLVALVVLAASACGSKVQGTYSDANGAFTLELRSGGNASFTFEGETQACTYSVDGKKLMLDCKGDKTVFTIHADGSLTGPQGSFMPALRKFH